MTRLFCVLVAAALLAAACSPGLLNTTPTATVAQTRQATVPTATVAQIRQATVASPGSPENYVTFSINVQDFAYPELSAETLRKIVALHERYQIPVDIYLSSTMVDLYERSTPDLLKLLRESRMAAISYHIRPPVPYAVEYDWLGLSQQTPASQYQTIHAYETHALDHRSGRPTESPGGYAKLAKILGYGPYVAAGVDNDFTKVAYPVFRDLGAHFTVVHGRATNLGEIKDGLFVKPEHVDLRLYQSVGQDIGEVVRAAFDEAHSLPTAHAPYFVGIKMHDNDFFAVHSAFSTVYLAGKREPPWDVNRKARLLAPNQQQSVWAHYESAVAFVASQRARFTPINAPVLLALEERSSAGPLPPSQAAKPTPIPLASPTNRITWTPGTVYLTVVSHNEEPSSNQPDFVRNSEIYRENRKILMKLAEMIARNRAAYNVQSDWNFLQAIGKHDSGGAAKVAGGMNLLRWMAETRGVEIDPHAHESRYNYADVAYLIQQLGVTPSKTVGGFLFSPPDNPQGWEKHRDGLKGRMYPDYAWKADILWGASSALHEGAEDHTSGAWQPQDRYNFYKHDAGQPLVYLGGCTGDTQGVLALLDAIESGKAPRDGFYTASIILVQDFLTDDNLRELEEFIIQIEPKVREGRVKWANLSEIAVMWQNDYQSKPFQYRCAE